MKRLIRMISVLFRPAPVVDAESRRNEILAEITKRRSHHREWKPLLQDLRRATNESLSQAGRG